MANEPTKTEPTLPTPTANAPTFTDDVLQFFTFAHLPNTLQAISEPFAQLAHMMVSRLPQCPQRTMMLNNLLAAKDAAVRALVWKKSP